MKTPSNRILGLVLVILVGSAAGIGYITTRGDGGEGPNPAGSDYIKSSKEREENPSVEEGKLQDLADKNSQFAFELYHKISDSGNNLFYSPYSIQLALAMSYAGARGETAKQMEETLNFDLSKKDLHQTLNALDQSLTERGENENFTLNIANSFWGQENYHFREEYLDTLAKNYGAGIRLLNFREKPEPSRIRINDWVENKTENKIKKLLPSGSITPETRAVLTNAIYFNASWKNPFQKTNTENGEFSLLDGSKVSVPMMSQTTPYKYTEGTDYQAVKLPYYADVSMVVMMPSRDSFHNFEENLSGDKVDEIVKDMKKKEVSLKFPKFEYSSKMELSKVLTEMGMPKAFGSGADFSGMTGDKSLFISKILHKAYVSVDEKGTEAAAATAVVMPTSAPTNQVEMAVDHPFIFVIRDDKTGTILFVGRVLNPSS